MKIIGTIIPTYLHSYKFSANWWSGDEKYSCFLFIACRALLQGMPNSTDFYKEIFLHVIPIRGCSMVEVKEICVY